MSANADRDCQLLPARAARRSAKNSVDAQNRCHDMRPKERFASSARYVRRRILSHAIVLSAVLAAVICAVGSQYAVKNLVDVLGSGIRRLIPCGRGCRAARAGGGGQSSVAARRLGFDACVRRGRRRHSSRSVQSSVRPGHALFRRAPSRCAGRPHHGRGECRLDHREFADLDHHPARGRGGRQHRHSRYDQLVPDRRAARRRRGTGREHRPAGGARQPLASELSPVTRRM